tara:strand:- start:136 stop:837 length:702 start_codon:yes stop_codon:yes gene_type:complete
MIKNIEKNYSINFNPKKRSKNKIRFIILHYTGMRNEIKAISKLTNIQSQVSCHFFIKNNGDIVEILPVQYVAWHAGKSKWKNIKSLNKNSIGVEISNPGHDFNYKKFNNKQIKSIIYLLKYLIQNFNINLKNILGHSDVAPDRKKDPGEKFPWEYLAKKKVCFWHKLKKNDLKKLRNLHISNIEKLNFFKKLNHIGYSGKNQSLLIKAFQRRFRQDLVNGKIDQECVKICKHL